MSDLIVQPGERGQVRLFLIPEPLAKTTETDLAPLQDALGGVSLNRADVQIVPTKTLGEMSVQDFLEEAYDIDRTTLPRLLDEVEGHIAILRSGAFARDGATLAPSDMLGFLGLYSERGAPPPSKASLDALRHDTDATTTQPDAPIEPAEPSSPGSILTFVILFGAGVLLMAFMIWSVLS